MVAMIDEQITTSAAARLVGCSEQTIRQWATSGRLPSVVTPLGRLYRLGDVARLVSEREAEARERRR